MSHRRIVAGLIGVALALATVAIDHRRSVPRGPADRIDNMSPEDAARYRDAIDLFGDDR